MGIAYKNFWSVNTDEAIVAGHLRYYMPKHIEVFMPLNAQMKDIDLIAYNHKNRNVTSLQIKGSRAYEPRAAERNAYGEGSATWFMFKREVIDKSSADYFIFLHYIIVENLDGGRRNVEPHLVTIPTHILKKQMNKNGYVVRGNRYALYTWVNPRKKKAFGIHHNEIDFSDYLDKAGMNLLRRDLESV